MKIGDKVSVLDEDISGEVTAISKNKITKYNLLLMDNVDNYECGICYVNSYDKIIKLECMNYIFCKFIKCI